VSEQELLRTATDCDTVARELRRQGGAQNLTNAAAWDLAARNLRAGKQAYVNQQAATIRQIGEQQATHVAPVVQPSPQADPRREAVWMAAVRRYVAFLSKDARTVSEQEMLAVAKDCDFVAQEFRREGNLEGAPAWEQSARNLRAGKVAYLKQIAEQQAQNEGDAAATRYNVFLKRDPYTVSEQELLRTASDCDTAAQYQRRQGGEQNLANAAAWDQAARSLRAGKEAWVIMRAIYLARDVAAEAAARYNAFLKKDPRTVSEQELLRTATDCDTQAQELRWEGGEQNLANAATWDQAARNLRAGKEAYVKQIATQAANSEMLQIYLAQGRARAQQNNYQALSNISTMNYVTRMNIIANMGNSGYHYEVRSR
jgi:hypothetical protein